MHKIIKGKKQLKLISSTQATGKFFLNSEETHVYVMAQGLKIS